MNGNIGFNLTNLKADGTAARWREGENLRVHRSCRSPVPPGIAIFGVMAPWSSVPVSRSA